MPVLAHITGPDHDYTMLLHETPLPGDTIQLPEGRIAVVDKRQFLRLPTNKELLAMDENEVRPPDVRLEVLTAIGSR